MNERNDFKENQLSSKEEDFSEFMRLKALMKLSEVLEFRLAAFSESNSFLLHLIESFSTPVLFRL
jgi:hypothetical protein